MNAIRIAPRLLRAACLAGLLAMASSACGQEREAGARASVTPLIERMAGTWEVRSRMWPGPGERPVELPPAVAHRAIVGNAFLQEVMEPADESADDPFARVAYFSRNPVNRQYEYFSLDSRLPQMMAYALPGANKVREGRVELAGTSFVAPEWGAMRNVPFMYRLAVGPVEGGRQVVQLFLTPQGGDGGEFLAFEYVYTRRP